ncbi:MAG: hypothetical protein OWV35_03950 [Firmicutes bacterium]|nr:hypothetical protein [Bacillota bacterium]
MCSSDLALTIVLAVAAVFGPRPALRGSLAAVAVLAVVVAVLGAGLVRVVPLNLLRGVVGGLLLLMGTKWLRKAIQRFAGLRAVHDEARAYAGAVERLRGRARREGQATAFNGVLVEGLEVAVIVLTMGSAGAAYASAVAGALAGLLAVGALGLALRAPLARVPENVMKFVVGIMLTSFGSYWAGSSLGIRWPGHDLAILLLIGGYLAVSWRIISSLTRRGPEREPA